MKKFLVVLMLVVSMVGFGRQNVVTTGEDKYSDKDYVHPGVAVIYNDQTDKYTLVRYTAAGGFDLLVGEFDPSLFKQPMLIFSPKYPDGKDSGDKYVILLKHKGKTYKNVSYETAKKVLKEIGFVPYI